MDDNGGSANCSSGQIMAYINDPDGGFCDWGTPRTECWSVRLPVDYGGEIPPEMLMIDVPEAEKAEPAFINSHYNPG